MAENSSHVAPETTVIQSDDEEQQKELYPNTVERRNTAVENCDAKTERTTNEKEEEDDHQMEAKSDQAQELQIQMQPQTDTRADSWQRKSCRRQKSLSSAAKEIAHGQG